MVDALVLGTSGAIHGGSSPLPPTNEQSEFWAWKKAHLCAFVRMRKNFSYFFSRKNLKFGVEEKTSDGEVFEVTESSPAHKTMSRKRKLSAC